jgi:hypothetical protein
MFTIQKPFIAFQHYLLNGSKNVEQRRIYEILQSKTRS